MPIAGPAGTETLEALLARLRRTGDPEDLGRVFDATSADLFRVALTLAPDAASAEDAVQETYLAVLEHLDRYDPARPARPWLLGILRMKVREVRRRNERVPDAHRLPPVLLPADPSTEAADGEEKRRVREALETLREPYRSVAILRWRYGLEPAEIAHARDESPGTVRSLLHRALGMLRTSLGGAPVLLLERNAGHGLRAVRDSVLSRARSRPVLPARSGTGLGAGAVQSLGTGGILMTAKKALAGILALLLLGALLLTLLRFPGDSNRPRAPASATASGRTSRPEADPAAAAPVDSPATQSVGPARSVVVRDALVAAPVPDAQVSWKVGAVSGKGTAGPDGTLEVRGIPEGDATLEARKDGFTPGTLVLEAGTWTAPAEILLMPGMAEAKRLFVAAAKRREEFLRHGRTTMWTLSWDTKGEHLFMVDRAIADMDGDRERWTRSSMMTKAEALDLPSDASQVSPEIAERMGSRNPGTITVFDGTREMAAYPDGPPDRLRWQARLAEKSDFYFRHGALVWTALRDEASWMSEQAARCEVRLCQPLEGGRVHWLLTATVTWGPAPRVWIQRIETAGGAELLPVLYIASWAAPEDLDAVVQRAASGFTELDAREEFVLRKTVQETATVSGILLPVRALGEAGYLKDARTRYWLSYEPRASGSWPEGHFDLDRNPDPSIAAEGEIWSEDGKERRPFGEPPR